MKHTSLPDVVRNDANDDPHRPTENREEFTLAAPLQKTATAAKFAFDENDR
jgi:hypothetical protein